MSRFLTKHLSIDSGFWFQPKKKKKNLCSLMKSEIRVLSSLEMDIKPILFISHLIFFSWIFLPPQESTNITKLTLTFKYPDLWGSIKMFQLIYSPNLTESNKSPSTQRQDRDLSLLISQSSMRLGVHPVGCSYGPFAMCCVLRWCWRMC